MTGLLLIFVIFGLIAFAFFGIGGLRTKFKALFWAVIGAVMAFFVAVGNDIAEWIDEAIRSLI